MRALRWLTVFLLVGCAGDDGDGDGDGAGAVACPEQAEICGYRDGGWEAVCNAGVVTMRSFNTTLYCAPPDPEILCEVGDPQPQPVHTCAGACVMDGDDVYLETIAEYHAFDPATLCQ
jgi:hypothetical protein